MKKIFLTGVVLILFIVIGVDLYRDHKRANEQKELQAIATPNDNTAAPVAATQTGNDMNSADSGTQQPAQAAAATTVSRTHYRHRRHHRAIVDKSLSGDVSGQDEMALASQADDMPLVVQSSNEYTGNIPKAQRIQQRKIREQKVIAKMAQYRSVRFGPEVGLMDNSFINVPSQHMDRLGFKAGAIADIRFGYHFTIQPGLLYELKGDQTHTATSNDVIAVDTKDKINLNYLEMPLDFVVKIGNPGNGQIMIGAGPYVSYLLSARDRYTTSTTSVDATNTGNPAGRTTRSFDATGDAGHVYETEQGRSSIPVGNSAATPGNTSLRRMDWGLNGFIGVQMPEGIFAKVGAEQGMMNIQHNPDGSYSDRNMNFFFSVGYLFGIKK